MKIAIASGKGGTGKTTLATNLAFVAARQGCRTVYADCDVEEPNGHLFLRPQLTHSGQVCVPVPVVDPEACTHCGTCASFCRFNALAMVGGRILVFPELCHGCGGCMLVCQNMAITEKDRRIGVVETGTAGGISFVQGRLDVGESTAPPVIKAVKAAISTAEFAFLDAPPGTSCPVIETVRDSDFVLLVTEPTPFGLNDLRLAIEALQVLELPCAVVINRADSKCDETMQWCEDKGIRVIAKIPEDRCVAEASSRGELAAAAIPSTGVLFEEILASIVEEVEANRRNGRHQHTPARELHPSGYETLSGRQEVSDVVCRQASKKPLMTFLKNGLRAVLLGAPKEM